MPTIAANPYPWPHDHVIDPLMTALVVIDMQRDFCEVGGYVSAMGYDVAPARALIPRIQAVLAAVRAWGGLVVHTREGHRPDLSDLPSQKRFRSANGGAEIGSRGPLGRLLVRGEAGWDIVPELAPAPGEPIIDKPGFSAFYATDLDRILAARGVRRLIVCGVTTDICVHSTIRDATERGYECLLLEDCCAATVTSNHAAALETIRSEGGIFGATARSMDVIGVLKAVTPAPRTPS
ncbi:cysteine hydrolase family protein [Rhizobium sp. TRM95796]|uniref:cysteine hydrolase family protein n=1 Tax=Rhizobium sp. TRM95796 TaxID=2979862 RepID=UPI0021E6F356|nr:isochorismatase family cysteine hydrolase [Rhizobium sp. TRM95796]MCV3765424.1 cysteine hydrolase [Rhizobium sp. TRM95796]